MMNAYVADSGDGPKAVPVEIASAEKQLWALIHSKGPLHPGIKDLYHKIRSIYETIILNDCQMIKEDVEYSLWKIHYKHIDEFRRRLHKSFVSANHSQPGTPRDDLDAQKNHNNHMKAFKGFLADASEFYTRLIRKIRQINSRKCRFSCHRFLVCLGDLARYMEFYEKADIQSCDWSTSAGYYLEATRMWPDSGNPHNQLGVLATYVGDEFLALYHWVRSLAVKDPFPDAWDNLMLLLEKNRDTLSKPSDVWSLFVRVVSFFYIKSSLDEFKCTLESMVLGIEATMALDETDLREALECYQRMNPAKTGPFRTVHAVTMLIFIVEGLLGGRFEPGESKYSRDIELPVLIELAWTAAFAVMVRLLDRCLKATNPGDGCPLLPAVLVFSEWLEGVLIEVEAYGTVNGENMCSVSSFFRSYAQLLNGFKGEDVEQGFSSAALWEDRESQGFEPLARAHEALDFSADHERLDGSATEITRRVRRIVQAATKIADTSCDSLKWLSYDERSRRFFVPDSKKIPEMDSVVEKQIMEKVVKSPPVDEEEVILFKPISRFDSAPLSVAMADHPRGLGDASSSSDERLSRASSMFAAQGQSQLDPPPPASGSGGGGALRIPVSSGPPSLNAWVLNGGKDLPANDLNSMENPSSSISLLASLSMTGTKDAAVGGGPPCYTSPVPSAPLLPEDAVGYGGDSYGPPKAGGYANWNPGRFAGRYPPLVGLGGALERFHQYRNDQNPMWCDGGPKWSGRYSDGPGSLRNAHAPDASRFGLLDRWGNPLPSGVMAYPEKEARYGVFPVVYDGQTMREKRFHGFPIPGPYACGGAVATDRPGGEQQRLMQYLKEKEWLMQTEAPPLRSSPTYIGK